MKVRFPGNWFGPAPDGLDKRDRIDSKGNPIPGSACSGVRYKKNVVYDLPDSFIDYLPKNAIVLDDTVSAKKVQSVNQKNPLHDADHDRAVEERMAEILAKV